MKRGKSSERLEKVREEWEDADEQEVGQKVIIPREMVLGLVGDAHRIVGWGYTCTWMTRTDR